MTRQERICFWMGRAPRSAPLLTRREIAWLVRALAAMTVLYWLGVAIADYIVWPLLRP